MKVAQELAERVGRAAWNAGISADLYKTTVGYALEHPFDLKNGDYATAIALQYASREGSNPRDFAKRIVEALGDIPGIAKIEVAGAGFINFYLAPSALTDTIATARGEAWGRNDANKGKKIMVEYTDPNPFKEFHIGHLMSNAIGESIARLLEFSGAQVKRANYQGDVGPHVAKAIWGLKKLGINAPDPAALGKAYSTGAAAYENDDGARAEIEALNAKLYDRSDADINALYDAGKKTSLAHFENIYRTLGTKFDYYFFESETAPTGIKIVREHSDVFVKSEGAIVYQGEKQGLHTRVFITSKGLPTYEAKELGLAQMKAEKWPFDSSISVTAHEQSGYFEVVLAAMREVAPELASKLRHISHGMMRLPSGKMSSRTGDVITGESLLAELVESAKERATDSRAEDTNALAEDVAVAAIKYQILKQASGRDIVFDRERALSLEGDSGPYLQYAHARAHAVVEKAREQNITGNMDTDAEPIELSRLLHRFPEAVEYAARELEPHLLTNYLLEFASAFNRWYANEQILDGSAGAPHKVALTDAARRTLKNGLWLLGIPAPEKM
ncbi:arginine--tRNA ligase [Candidatus Kaiserbacteria bacterium RIFCSPHIGHO2_02_FULL_59_21]|uniref:Arginine--tRNA ligase n=1 Tax=Candidatus Kaiserbacteria bacterium RIFCSPHIGHO2_02_FULL_59_21 TaxID=1798500 RepID=A0A1F6E0I6_9BACT|nr:MAG: arginine--tRNA ligase [Candidatus Kaiserbacteria bacterium RIFCSPHIGHO2_01_FULL_58_22]OGG67060.1 MAG: arginine--tRNA ligase [Candidatus Kaiserbacteria bacterium RIFCSPHIGHO2_02_FULL_59_21]OGG79482.1 MAG: arginine--tRNA ligase [Candidatus Kaiserbacteria bacterium RIFCSPLOWO2_01_FULL_59_34]OGG86824.1 MAG: arginine--tRNA ligase [Candidatus Kaiserbacteria bacterium RIFCSPLOWO2_02_FULL_59_19]